MGVYVAASDLRNLRPLQAGPRPGGNLTWAAALVTAAGALTAAAVLGDSRVFMATAVCAAFGIAFAINPTAGVAAIVVVRPSLDLWADRPLATAGSLALNPASLMALMFIAIGGAYVIERWQDVKTAPVTWPYLGLAVMAVLSIIVAPSKGGASTETLRLASIAILYMAVWAVIRDRRGLLLMVAALLASLVVPTVVAIWQFAHGGSTVIGETGRSAGTFLHPDPFGVFLGFMCAMLLPLLLCRRFPGRALLVVAFPVVLLALIASYTRTGWVGFGVGVLVLALVRYRSILVVAPLALILVAAALPSTVHRFSDLTSGRTHYGPGNSLRARVDLWRSNLPKVAHNPVIGNGFKSIVEDTTGTKGGGVNVVEGAHSHSDFVRAVVELGVPGLVFFGWLLFGAWAGCRRAFRRARRGHDPTLAAISLGALAAMSAYLVMSFDSNLMTQVAVAGTAWTVAAVGHAAGRVELVSDQERSQ